MKKNKLFNINNNVWVKLNDYGMLIHKKHYNKYKTEYIPPHKDDEGWSKFQLWTLMSIYGKYMYNGCNIPFETDILFNVPQEKDTNLLTSYK